MCAKSLQSCPTLCDPMDYSLPGPSVHEILQASILKWVAFPFSRGSSQPRDQTPIFGVSCIGRLFLNPLAPWEAPFVYRFFFLNQNCVCVCLCLMVGGGKKNEGEEERDWWNGSLKGFSSIYFMKKSEVFL